MSLQLSCLYSLFSVLCFNDTATTEIYPLSLHDALPIWILAAQCPNLTAFTPPEKIQSTDRAYRCEGGYVAVIGEMRVDSDGSPVAYHPLNLGTTHLCNGLDPVIDGKRVRDKKRATSPCFAAVEKAIQAKWDPARSPEFFIYGFVAPTTGAKWGGPSGGK